MRRIIFISSLLILVAFVFVACGQSSPSPMQGGEVKTDGGSYWDITSVQLKSMLENKDFLLVHTHLTCNKGIPDTNVLIPYDAIEQNLSKLPEDKGAKMVLYCHDDSMSATAAKALVSLGYTSVYNLDGGLVEWEKQGYEINDNP